MASKNQVESARTASYGAILLVIHEFTARSTDELSLAKGDRIELIERDDDFGDGWYLGRHLANGKTGLFPEVYTTRAPKGTLPTASGTRSTNQITSNQRSSSTPTHVLSQLSQSVAGGAARSPTKPASPGQRESTEFFSQNQSQGSIAKVSQSTASTSSKVSDRTSAVMNETLSVIDEHITDMKKPSLVHPPFPKNVRSDSASSYGLPTQDHRLSYIQGSETEEEESNKLTEKEVKNWSPERVAEYLEDAGVEKRHCEVFIEQEFSGEVVLGLDQSSVFLKELDLGPIGRRLKTWQKIRALQEEVTGPRPSHTRHVSETSQASRRTSVANSSILARSSNLIDDNITNSTTQTGQLGSPLTTPSHSLRQSPRPSAASVRSLGHSRRQSSIDQTINPPASGGSTPHSPYPPQSGHQRQSSTDHNLNMTSSRNRSTGELARPSPTYLHSNASSTYDKRASQVALNSNRSTTIDVDRGYVSSGETDNRSNKKRVLRKRDGAEHSRAASYDTTSKRRSILSFRRSSRNSSPNRSSTIGSPALNQDSSKPAPSPSKPRAARVYSEPTVDGSSPTVTKLEYDDKPDDKDLPRPPLNQSPATTTATTDTDKPLESQTTSQPTKAGLRVISDAITNKEKAMHSVWMDSATTASNSSPQSPTSSTTASKSIDYDAPPQTADIVTSSANQSKFSTPSLPSARRKSKSKPKKKTSAYIRGLEKKSPQEQMVGCDYSGWMKKKSSNLMTTWKPRFFVLKGRRLSYYYSEHDTEEKGLIDISGHRVLPADNEKVTSLHATLTGAMSSPTSPQTTSKSASVSNNTSVAASPASTFPASSTNPSVTNTPNPSATNPESTTGTFIFKLLPPRSGLSKAVNFTKPSIHYFAVPSLAEGRGWMAAMLKSTIDRDESVGVVTTYQLKTISLAKARARGERPREFRGEGAGDGDGEEAETEAGEREDNDDDDEDDDAEDAEGEGESLAQFHTASTDPSALPTKNAPAQPQDRQHDEKKDRNPQITAVTDLSPSLSPLASSSLSFSTSAAAAAAAMNNAAAVNAAASPTKAGAGSPSAAAGSPSLRRTRGGSSSLAGAANAAAANGSASASGAKETPAEGEESAAAEGLGISGIS